MLSIIDWLLPPNHLVPKNNDALRKAAGIKKTRLSEKHVCHCGHVYPYLDPRKYELPKDDQTPQVKD